MVSFVDFHGYTYIRTVPIVSSALLRRKCVGSPAMMLC